MKKLVLASLFMQLLMAFTVYGGNAPIVQSGGTGTATTEITAQIQASAIQAAVPLVYEFSINPNELNNGAFQAPDMNITNNSKFPLNVSVVSLKAQASNRLKVVDVDLYSDSQWNTLGQGDSLTHISLGFENPRVSSGTVETSGFYMEEEASQREHLLASVNAAGVLSLKMQGKHGRSFANVGTYNYNCIIKLALVD